LANLVEDLKRLRIARNKSVRGIGRTLLGILAVAICLSLGIGYYKGTWIFAHNLEVECVRPTMAPSGSAGPESRVLTASGYVVARREAVVSSKIQGLLVELDVDVGSRVSQGQVIARLGDADYFARVESAKADLQQAQATLDESNRQWKLTEALEQAKVMSRDQKDAAASRAKVAEASLAAAVARLNLQEAQEADTFIRAPFTGVVVKKMAEVGESVAPIPPGVNISTSSGAIVALADMDSLEAHVDVNESNTSELEPGQPAEIVVRALPDRIFRGVLRQMVPTADRTKATVQANVTIFDRDKNLKPEMSADVNFLKRPPTKREKANAKAGPGMTIPKETLATRAGKTVVFTVQDGKVSVTAILVGKENAGMVAVLHGLEGSESLVVHPPPELQGGEKVNVVSERGEHL